MFFAQSGDLKDLLRWFYAHQPSWLDDPNHRVHPLFLCLTVPGGRSSQAFLRDLIQHRNSLDVLLGPDVALFVFGASRLECAIPSYRPYYGEPLNTGMRGEVDVSRGLGVWKKQSDLYSRPKVPFHFWTIDQVPERSWRRDFPRMEAATSRFSDQVICEFKLRAADLPALVLLYADAKVAPWILPLTNHTDTSRLFDLIRSIRSLAEDMHRKVSRDAETWRRVEQVRDYPSQLQSLEDELSKQQQVLADQHAAVAATLEPICRILAQLGLPQLALRFLSDPWNAAELFVSLGYHRHPHRLPTELLGSEAILEQFRANPEHRSLIRKATKNAHVLTLALGELRRRQQNIAYHVKKYEAVVKEIMQAPDQRQFLGEVEATFLEQLNTVVSAFGVEDSPARDIGVSILALDHFKESAQRWERIRQSTGQRPILLVCATSTEMQAVRVAFAAEIGTRSSAQPIGSKEYFDLGTLNTNRVLLTSTEMGSVSPSASLQSIETAVRSLQPAAVLLIGIAFGMDESKQHIGNVLVSKQIVQYESQKVSADGLRPRGDRVTASTWLLEKLRNSALDWTGAEVQFGLLLTGEKLIDNLALRTELQALEPEAIGGEMEAAGLYAACRQHNVDGIVVKAICDWAHAKSTDKENRQQLAATTCAAFIVHTLKTSVFARIGSPDG